MDKIKQLRLEVPGRAEEILPVGGGGWGVGEAGGGGADEEGGGRRAQSRPRRQSELRGQEAAGRPGSASSEGFGRGGNLRELLLLRVWIFKKPERKRKLARSQKAVRL